jgi:hypothetical protein
LGTFIKREYAHNRPNIISGQAGIFTTNIIIIMYQNHELFISAIHNTDLLNLTFNSKEKGVIQRTCAPLDYGVSRRHNSSQDMRYHLWDYDSSDGEHPLSILPEQVVSIELVGEKFSPSTIIDWTPNWHLNRDWGMYS